MKPQFKRWYWHKKRKVIWVQTHTVYKLQAKILKKHTLHDIDNEKQNQFGNRKNEKTPNKTQNQNYS